MEEQKMNEKESLELIAQMIRVTNKASGVAVEINF